MYDFDFEENEKWQKGLDLTHAVWRITDVSLRNENLKEKIKDLSSSVLIKYTNHLSEKEENEREMISSINSLIALLSLAQKTSNLREINFLILKNEYKKIKFHLSAKLETKKLNNKDAEAIKNKKSTSLKEDEKEVIVSKKNSPTIKEYNTEIKKEEDRKLNTTKEEEIIENLKSIRRGLSDRQDVIFDFFKKRRKEKIQLKDVKKLFPNMTDRTIRNDLKKLCDRDLIKRSNGKGQASFYYIV